jgi:sialate O-acetylesterase
MVLQQEKPVSVWGKATPGLTVRVQFAGQEKSVIAASDSSWKLWLDPMPASFEARSMRILTPVSDTVLSDILVGEVWLCGGQSNMEYPMDRTLKRYAPPARGNDLAAEEWRKGGNTAVRLIQIEKINSLPDCTKPG